MKWTINATRPSRVRLCTIRRSLATQHHVRDDPACSGYVEAFQGLHGCGEDLLRYLAGMTDFSIVYNRGGFKLTAFSDTNWGNNSDNGKPMSLYIMMMASAPVSFKAGIQMLTGVLTMEAELVAAALALKEIVFCSKMMTEVGSRINSDRPAVHRQR